MFHTALFRPVVVLFALAPLGSSGTLTVGPAGSGAQFTEIQAAIDAAADGDVILVKPGTYQQIVASKPLRILGDGTGVVRLQAQGSQFGAWIRDIASGKELVLSGVEVAGSTDLVLLQNCAGTVVLSDVQVLGGNFMGGGVSVVSCARAVLLDSQIAGVGALWASSSEVWLASATLQGKAGSFSGDGFPGIQLENSTLHAWRSRILGGDAVFSHPKGGRGGIGLHLVNSRADLFGGPGSEIRGGRGVFDPAIGIDNPGGTGMALTQGSRVRIQSSIPVSGGFDSSGMVQAPATFVDASSTLSSDPETFPTLASSAQQAQLGSSFALTLTGNPGGYQVLFASLRTGPTTVLRRVDGFGLLDLGNMKKIASEVLPPSATFTLNLRVPNMPALIGTTFFFQAAEQVGTAYAIGNPVLVTITG